MTRISAFEHSDSIDQLAPDSIHGPTTAQNIVISPAGLTEIPVPGQGFITNAVMTQEGSDLILETPDGITIVIEGYFSADTPPNLISPDGKVLTPALVKSFIQASTDYAEDTTAMNDATPVGEVHEVSGSATVTHPDGTKESIVKGTHIFEGDVVETDAQGAVNIQFADESSFAISNNAKMAIDEFVFDSKTNDGENNFSMLRGLFVYTSGLVGREDPDDVKINTPVGSIGIRGTIITGVLPEEGSSTPAQISVVEGAIVVTNNSGTEVTLSQQFETVQIGASGEMTNIGPLPQGEMIQTFNVLRTVAPTLFSSMEEAGQETAPDGETSVDAPAVEQEAAPADDQAEEPVQQETAPVEQPAPTQPDVIKLNLLEDRMDSIELGHDSVLQQETQTSLSGTTTLAAAATMVAAAAPALITTTTTSAATAAAQTDSSTATTPAVVDTSSPTTPPVVAPVNHAPTASVSTHFLLEQGGMQGASHTIDVSQFFSDVDGDNLTYIATLGTGQLAGITVDGNGLLTFAVDGALATLIQSASFSVRAFDGTTQSASITFNLNLYQNNYDLTAGDDTEDVNITPNNIVAAYGGNDTINVSTVGNVIFAGEGEDIVTIFSGYNNNKVFGEDGGDSITVLGGTGNTVSGGGGDDSIIITLTANTETFSAFGGTGNDTITLGNANTLAQMGTGGSVVDGGLGFDTLVIGSGLSLDLTTLPVTSTLNIEKIRMASTGPATLTLDLDDIFVLGQSGQTMYLDVDGNDTINITNNLGAGAFTQQAGTTTDITGEQYNIFSNGDMTLYISVDANMANVSGI